jgi:hypothetical protein
MRRINDFAGSFVFRDLTAFSFRRFCSTRFFTQNPLPTLREAPPR